jgi:hypothetical protein
MKYIFLSFFLITVFPAVAQNHKEEVQAVVNKLFKGMQDADSNTVASVFMSEAIMQTIITSRDNQSIVRQESVSKFVSSVGRQKAGTLNEIIEFDAVKVDLPLAFVWTPYRFYYNGTFSHSGVNAFCLVQTSAGWKIQYIIDTRKK